MSTQHDEHDPHISALYRKAGDIEPPASLDKAVLTTARRAARQRRQRWMLPLSTAAVIMFGITVLLKLNSEWQFSRDLEGSAPTQQSNDTLAEKAEPTVAMAPQKRVREATSVAGAPAEMLAQKPAPASPEPAESKALKAAPSSIAGAQRSEQEQQLARAKAESAATQAFAADTAAMSDSTVPETDKGKATESPIALGMAAAEQEVLQPRPWIEKIRKLVEAKKMDEARKELEAFRKHYPDYKLPGDLKSL